MEKSYEPKNFEGAVYAEWLKKKYFSAAPNKAKKPFTIMMPPPNITGRLHMGHALNNSIQDVLTRYKRMKGFEALWLPGTDHASIATELKIVEALRAEGKTKEGLGREGFLRRAYEWNDDYGGRIVEQLKSLGCSCDWDRLAFTMDEKLSAAVLEVFASLYEEGLIYRGDRIVNWCPACKTALSDAEVEHAETASHLWHMRYPLADGGGYITVATTRPETMLGDTAVAVNPDDPRYAALVGKSVALPLTNRVIPVIADSYVDKTFGTGAVKITPAHDPNDFEVGARHGLPLISVLDDAGRVNSNGGRFAGLDRYEARKQILAELQKENLLEKTEKHNNSVGRCYRCGAVVEPMVKKQWFVAMETLAKPAIEAVKSGKVKFLPKRFEKIYLHWLQNIRDWCISRQLWWGHRIPAYYCDKCGKVTVSRRGLTKCPDCGGEVKRDEDVLDTWFSSALWPFSTLGYPQKTEDLDYFYPTDALVTAYDIIFFWVARMVFSGVKHMGEPPFKTVFINGLVRDATGRKMSKTLNNGIDPLEIIDKYGADPLRFSLLRGITPGSDTRFIPEKIEASRNFMNKIWNAARFVLQNKDNCDGIEIGKIKNFSYADKWILTRLSDAASAVNRYMDRYEIGRAADRLYGFVWDDFCDWYIELAKTDLYGADKAARSRAFAVLVYVLREALKMLHPFVPFVTEEIYKNLPNKDAESIMIAPFPQKIKAYKKDAAGMQRVMELIRGIRNVRAESGAPPSRRTAIYMEPQGDSENLLRACANYIEKLAYGTGVYFKKPSERCAGLIAEAAAVYLPAAELVDTAAENERLQRELAAVIFELNRAAAKLANEGFIKKAPPALIAEEKEKLEKYSALKEKLEKSLRESAPGKNSVC
ncbi:MAG: valine--tRNA ligase [Clostridiales bacterium]|jgi:valyl-tRNA synthetase|nr:valine--tRNA ligase [Clostridiales bacterium]